jgi:hypothetical protein
LPESRTEGCSELTLKLLAKSRETGWSQWVIATLARSLLAGVSNPNDKIISLGEARSRWLKSQLPTTGLLGHNRASPQELIVTNAAKRLALWFVLPGVFGILVAIALAVLARQGDVNQYVLLLLWPPSFVGLVDLSSLSDKIIFGVVELGGNFIIYGFIGLFVGMVVEA